MNDTELENRFVVIEQALWGRSGQNGIAGDFKAFRQEFRDYVEAEVRRREAAAEAAKAEEEEAAREKRADRRARWGLYVAVGVAGMGPILGHALGWS